MANTHHYEIIGESHLRGVGGGETGVVRPPVIGKSEQLLELLDLGAGLGGIVEGSILEQIPLGVSIRARVVKVVAQSVIDARLVVEPVAADQATLLWPTQPGDDPAFAWDTYGAMNIDGVAATATVTRVTTVSGVEGLNQEALERVTAQTTFYDAQAKLAQHIDIAGYTDTPSTDYLQPGDQISCAPSGATFIVAGYEVTSGTTARVYMSRIAGTPAVADTLTNDQVNRALSGVTISAVGAAETAGRWVQFCATPSLGRSLLDSGARNYVEQNVWDVPPRGDQTDSAEPGLGPIAKLLENIERHHQRVDDPGDAGHRLLMWSSNDNTAGEQGFVAGVSFQRINITSQAGTWAVGDTVTASGSWSGIVAGTDDAGIVYVHSTNGETLANADTLTTTSGGTGTATGAALGWAPGSLYWNEWVAKRAEARAAPGATEGGAAIVSAGLFLMIWEGEVAPFASLGTVQGSAMLGWWNANPVTVRKQWVDWAAAVRVALGVDVPLTMWLHSIGSQPNILTGSPANLIPGAVNFLVRNFLKTLPTYVEGLTVVDSDERGHKMATAQDGSDSTLWLRSLDYVDVGQLLWSSFYEPTLAAPPGNFEVLPVVIGVASQSQLVASNKSDQWALADGDPDLWCMNDFPGLAGTIDTRDPNLLVWNHAVEELQVGDCSTNFNTFWTEQSTQDTSGPLLPVMQRFKQRYGLNGASSKVAMFKAAVGGSCYSQNVTQAAGCWSPSLGPRPVLTLSVTVSHVVVGPTTYARFTASPGDFASLVNGHSVVISGSSGEQSAGGNNTAKYGFNTANTVQSVDDSFFDIVDSAGTIFADGVETLDIAVGPPPLWPELERQWNLFVRKAAEAGYIVRPVAIITEQGESDLSNVSEYPTALDEVWTGLVDLLALRAEKNDQDIAKCIVQLSANSPFSATEEPINELRGYQATKASSLTSCVLVDPSSLGFESSESGASISSPPFPRQYRLENAIHFSGLAQLTKGYLIDQALGTLTALIPAHPKGDLQLFANVNNGANLELGEAPVDGGDAVDGGAESGATDGGAAEASVLSTLSGGELDSMLEALENAWSTNSDIFSYSVAGTTVTRNTPAQMIELHRYLRSLKQETRGIRRTRAVFNG